jgi:hypothetical protein
MYLFKLINFNYCQIDSSPNQSQAVKSTQASTVIVSTHNSPLVINNK